MSVQVSYKKQILFGIMVICILLVIIEISGRIILDQSNSCYSGLTDSGIYKESNINIKKLCSDYTSVMRYDIPIKHYLPNQYSETTNINSMGFRGNEIMIDKADDQYRIFFLGGSTAYGVYATSDQTTIPGYLQEKFENMNVEIINAGVGGAGSFDEIYLIENKLMNLSPNLFIIYDGWNDLADPVRTEYKEWDFQDDINLVLLKLRSYYKTMEFSEFVDRVITKQIYGEKGKPEESISKYVTAERITLWKDRWSETCELGNEKGIKTVILVQPILGTANKELHHWEKHMLQKYEHALVVSHYDDLITASLDLKKHCTLVVDLTQVFDDRTEFIYYDLGHMTNTGNEIIAEEIYEKILPVVLEDVSD